LTAPLQFFSLASSPFFSPLLNATAAAAVNPLNSLSINELQANDSLAQLLSNIVKQSQNVVNTAGPLLDLLFPATPTSANPVFQERLATSDNTTVAFATAPSGGASIGANTLTVSKLAVAQTNLGPAVPSGAATGAAAGNDTFNVLINGKTTPITVSIAGGDTNQSAMTKLSTAINQANIGLQSTVINSGGMSQVQIQSTNTGVVNGFTMFDVTGNLIANTGANTIETAPVDAAFTFNGLSMTSPTNSLSLSDGNVNLTLVGTSANPVTLSIKPNATDITNATLNFADAYNNLQSLLTTNLRFLPQIADLSSRSLIGPSLSSALTQIGISVGPTGALNFSPATITGAVTNNLTGLRNTLGGINGLASVAEKAASAAVQFPPSIFSASAGTDNTPQNLDILFLLNSSGILKPFILQKGIVVNTFT